MSEHMQANMLVSVCPACGIAPPRGWVVRGAGMSVCRVGSLVCIVAHGEGNVSEVLQALREAASY